MKSLIELGRIVDDRRNWPTLVLAAAFAFIGLLLLDALGFKNGFTMILMVIGAGFLANYLAPFQKPEDAAS